MNIEKEISKVDKNPKLMEARYSGESNRNGWRRKGHFSDQAAGVTSSMIGS